VGHEADARARCEACDARSLAEQALESGEDGGHRADYRKPRRALAIARWMCDACAAMSYFSIDCEASGPVAPLYSLLSIGATAVHAEGDRHAIGSSFYVELQPVFPGVDRKAIEVCGLDLERLRAEGLPPADALDRLARFVAQENRAPGGPVFVGHNAVFDWAYIDYYFVHFGVKNPFGYKGIDTKSLAMGRLGIAWTATSKENLQRLLGLPAQDAARVHRADYDAHYQALILQALLDPPRRLDTPGAER
jgi:DNA polymerase III epsilon subunit-like protein